MSVPQIIRTCVGCVNEYKTIGGIAARRNVFVNQIIKVEEALLGGTELMSNQGQAMDGYSALANFQCIARDAMAFEDAIKELHR